MQVTNNQAVTIRSGRYIITIPVAAGAAEVSINPNAQGWQVVPESAFTAGDSSIYTLPAGQVRVALNSGSAGITAYAEYNETGVVTEVDLN